jgi:hypothetical protein
MEPFGTLNKTDFMDKKTTETYVDRLYYIITNDAGENVKVYITKTQTYELLMAIQNGDLDKVIRMLEIHTSISDDKIEKQKQQQRLLLTHSLPMSLRFDATTTYHDDGDDYDDDYKHARMLGRSPLEFAIFLGALYGKFDITEKLIEYHRELGIPIHRGVLHNVLSYAEYTPRMIKFLLTTCFPEDTSLELDSFQDELEVLKVYLELNIQDDEVKERIKGYLERYFPKDYYTIHFEKHVENLLNKLPMPAKAAAKKEIK